MNTYPCKAPEGLFIVANYPKPDIKMAPDRFIKQMCHTHEIARSKVMGQGRRRDVVLLRHALMVALYYKYGWSFKRVGRMFNRDHSTIIHARDKFRDMVETGDKDVEFMRKVVPDVVELFERACSYKRKRIAA